MDRSAVCQPGDVLHFWFADCDPEDWWSADPKFDARVRDGFARTHAALAHGEGFTWRADPRGRLAEIIVLDQFSRQLHRGSPIAFAQDGMALALAQEAILAGCDVELTPPERTFLYMPLMHAESLVMQRWAVELFTALGIEQSAEAAVGHCNLIERFGRFPLRNKALGRVSTPEELDYIAQAGARMF